MHFQLLSTKLNWSSQFPRPVPKYVSCNTRQQFTTALFDVRRASYDSIPFDFSRTIICYNWLQNYDPIISTGKKNCHLCLKIKEVLIVFHAHTNELVRSCRLGFLGAPSFIVGFQPEPLFFFSVRCLVKSCLKNREKSLYTVDLYNDLCIVISDHLNVVECKFIGLLVYLSLNLIYLQTDLWVRSIGNPVRQFDRFKLL